VAEDKSEGAEGAGTAKPTAKAAEKTVEAADETAAPEAAEKAEEGAGAAPSPAAEEKTAASLEELGEALGAGAPPPEEAVVREPRIDAFGRAYATGKRKNAVARVWIRPGAGVITVNGKSFEEYFARPVLRMILQQPLEAASRKEQYDVVCTVAGGGLSGQAGAVRHGR